MKETEGKEQDLVMPSDIVYKWSWTPKKNSDGSEYVYTGRSLSLLQFSCTVDEDASFEEKKVGFKSDETDEPIVADKFADPLSIAKEAAVLTIEKAKVHVTNVSLDKAAITLKDGETAKLTATVIPAGADDKTMKWSSDNTNVVTVAADGTVMAVKVGTAKITVSTTDGNKTASCTVTVSCNHALTQTAARPAGCVNDGNVAYYTCSKCNKKYEDAAGTKEIADVTVKAKGHAGTETGSDADSHWTICAVCGTAFGESTHTFTWKVDRAATEDATGLKHEECVCGVKRNENTVIDKLDHAHIGIEKHEAVAATCKTKGSVEYWTCASDKCQGKYYGDAACQTEIKTVETSVNPDNHVYDNDSDDECNLCGNKREIQKDDDDDAAPAPAAVQVSPAISPKTGEARKMPLVMGTMAAGIVFAAGWIVSRKKRSQK